MSEAAEESMPPRRDAAAHEAAVRARLRRRRSAKPRRRSNSGLALRIALFSLGGVILLGAAFVSVLYLMLVRGPVNADMLGGRIASALSARLGGAYAVTVGRTTIESGAHGPFIAVSDLRVSGEGGQSVFMAPRATVALDIPRLAIGQVTPRRIELFDLELKMVLTQDGSVTVSAGAAPFLVGRAPGADPSGQSPPLLPPVGEHAAVRALGDALRRTLAVAVGAQSPAGSIEHIGISRGRLAVDDRAGNRSALFEGLELAVDRDHESALLSISATGPNGRWSVAAQARGDGSESNEGPRSLELEVRDLSAAEMSLMFNLQAPPVDFDTPVSARLQLGLDERGRLKTAAGRFALGAGFFYFRNRDHEPLRVDEITGRMNWDAQARRFDVGPVNYQAGRSNLTFGGRIEPPHENAQQWRIELSALPGVLGAERPGEMDVDVTSARLVARVDPGAKTAQVESFDLAGPQLAVKMSADGQWITDDRRLRANVEVSDTAAQAVLRIWPSIVAPQARAWFLSHKNKGRVEKGRISVDLDEKSFESLKALHGVEDSAVSVEGNVVDAELAFMPGTPPVSGLSGRLRVSGRSAAFTIASGYIETGPDRRLTIVEGRFESGEFGTSNVKGQVNVRATGSLDAAAELVAAEGLKGFGGFALDSGLVRGQVDGRVTIDLGFEPLRTPVVRVAAQITNMSVERVIGRERLDQASLALTADAAGARAAGQGRLLGSQVKIELRKTPGSLAEASVSALVDEATRARHGWQSANLSGVVGAKVTTQFGGSEKSRPLVELDLSRAGIAPIAGFSKPVGRPAKASFAVHQDPQQTTLQSFVFEAGPASAQGVIELDASGGFTGANFSQLKLSPGDDMKAEVASTRDGGFRVQARGASLDARPFVQDLMGASGRESAPAPPIDLDVRSNLVTGANGQALSAFELKLVTRAEGIREFKLTARSGRAAVSGGPLNGQPGAPQQFFVRTEDGGGLLAFLDLYRRMDGGQLQLTGYGNGRRATGALSVRNFTLRNEAALQKLVAEGARGREAQLPIDPNAVQFDRLEVAFSRNNGRLDLKDGVVSGPSVGATIEGGIDFNRDQVALNGTFVPAYGLNNMFSRIPLFGPLLGGGANEGLIGINFRITGSASAPVMSFNPLSAMTPGFLRKIFGAADAVTLPPQTFPAQPEQKGKPAMPMSINPR
ncbi:MAG: DUF3971 domain-containing protein [Beijerinckiaceae bacterium]|nr:DUF3971 domain-containing protein [Beijerinckiaceae bacterium]